MTVDVAAADQAVLQADGMPPGEPSGEIHG